MKKTSGESGRTAGSQQHHGGGADARKKRLAEQLRQNLHRRKAQSRLRRNINKSEND